MNEFTEAEKAEIFNVAKLLHDAGWGNLDRVDAYNLALTIIRAGYRKSGK